MNVRTPSPAVVLAALALAVALGGTAYAASLPKNSVGSPQVKPNSLKGGDIKESTLQGVLLAKGNGRAGGKVLPPNTGYKTLVAIPKVGRIEATCGPTASSSLVHLFNTTGTPAWEWVKSATGFTVAQIAAHGYSVSYSTTSADLRTWFVRSPGTKRLTMITVVTKNNPGFYCEAFAVAESMKSG